MRKEEEKNPDQAVRNAYSKQWYDREKVEYNKKRKKRRKELKRKSREG